MESPIWFPYRQPKREKQNPFFFLHPPSIYSFPLWRGLFHDAMYPLFSCITRPPSSVIYDFSCIGKNVNIFKTVQQIDIEKGHPDVTVYIWNWRPEFPMKGTARFEDVSRWKRWFESKNFTRFYWIYISIGIYTCSNNIGSYMYILPYTVGA